MRGKSLLIFARPPNRWDSVGVHLPFVAGSGAILLAAALLPAGGVPFGPTCMFLQVTGYPCPLCGSTRAFVAMGHARWHDAWQLSPMAAVLYVIVAGIFLWNGAALAGGLVIKPSGNWMPAGRRRWWIAALLCAIIVANWAYRISTGQR